MRQTYLDTIILKVIENSGNDPDLRPDFVHRVINDQLKSITPYAFFPIMKVDRTLRNGQFFMEQPFIEIIAITKVQTTPNFLCIVDGKVYDPKILSSTWPVDPSDMSVVDYIIGDQPYNNASLLTEFNFDVSVISNNISVYTTESEVSVFFYSTYKDQQDRTVVPRFAENYLEAYGTLRAFEVLLNKGLKGRTPGLVPQTRYTIKEMRSKVTREYLSMQRDINLLLEKVILKPVNSVIDATI